MGFLNSAGQRLHYVDAGQGEAVLLLHGLGSCVQDWAAQIEALRGRFRVIALDLRGHGASAPATGAYVMRDLAHDAAGLMTQLGIAHYQVVGFSMGGMVAFELALLCPAQVRRLVIVNSGPRMAGDWRTRLQLHLRLAIICLLGLRRLAGMIGRRLFPLPAQAHLLESFTRRLAQMDVASYCHAVRAIGAFSVESQIAALVMPVLVVSADQDYTPVAAKAAYARQLANAELVVIENSRHATPIDQPDALNRVLLNFLQPADQNPTRAPTPSLTG